MDNVSKMRASLKGGLKPRDTLIPTKETPAPSPVVAAPRQQPMAVLYPEKLQIPVTMQQEILLSTIAKQLQANRGKIGQREGESINKGTIIRCLIRLLEDVQIGAEDRPLSEDQVFDLLKNKLGIK